PPSSVPGGRTSTRTDADLYTRIPPTTPTTPTTPARPPHLLGADDLEIIIDENVMRPVDSDYVDVVIAVAQQNNTVDGASLVSGVSSGLGLVSGICCAVRSCPGA